MSVGSYLSMVETEGRRWEGGGGGGRERGRREREEGGGGGRGRGGRRRGRGRGRGKGDKVRDGRRWGKEQQDRQERWGWLEKVGERI